MEGFGPTLSGPLLSGQVAHPIPPQLSAVTNSGSKRLLTVGVGKGLDSRARVHISDRSFQLCTGEAGSLFCAFISSGSAVPVQVSWVL